MGIAKTLLGQQVLKDRSIPLTPRQRAIFILVDGRRDAAGLLGATAGAGVTQADLDHLFEQGLVEEVVQLASTREPVASAAPAVSSDDPRSPQQRYAEAYPIATQLTAGLGLRGFRLNLAIEAAGSYADLVALAPKIEEAVGAKKFAPLAAALGH